MVSVRRKRQLFATAIDGLPSPFIPTSIGVVRRFSAETTLLDTKERIEPGSINAVTEILSPPSLLNHIFAVASKTNSLVNVQHADSYVAATSISFNVEQGVPYFPNSFFSVLPLEVVSKKIIKNIPYGNFFLHSTLLFRKILKNSWKYIFI